MASNNIILMFPFRVSGVATAEPPLMGQAALTPQALPLPPTLNRGSVPGGQLLENETFESHKTKIAERWDLIAYDYWANPYAYKNLWICNIGYSDRLEFEAAIPLKVPQSRSDSDGNSDGMRKAYPVGLPPWKR